VSAERKSEQAAQVQIWISRYQASKGAMERTAHQLRWLIAATGFFSGGALALTFLEVITSPESVKHWPLAKTFMVCVLLVIAYLLFLNCVFWMALICDKYDELSRAVNTNAALTLQSEVYQRLASFAQHEQIAGAGWHVFGVRVDKRLFLASVASGLSALFSILQLLGDLGLFDFEAHNVFAAET